MRIACAVTSARPVAIDRLALAVASALICVLVSGWSVAPDGRRSLSSTTGIPGYPCHSWAHMSSPNVANDNNMLAAVATISASNAWAVGTSTNASNVTQSLIEQWDGHAWTIVSSPSPAGSMNSQLTAIAASSPTDVWAVGSYYASSSSYSQTLILHYNGTAWSVVPSPDRASTNNALEGVVIAGSAAWAVGYTTVDIAQSAQTLAEEWNGTSWSIVSTPNPTIKNALRGVTATSAGTLWAVGYQVNASGVTETLIEQWSGTAWTVAPSPNTTNAASSALVAVTAVSDSDVWAVGSSVYTTYPGTHDLPLIEQWNGSSWTIVAGQPVANNFADLLGVTGGLGMPILAVGEDVYRANAWDQSTALSEMWSSTQNSWTNMAPSPGAFSNLLYGVSADGQRDVFAVGVAWSSSSSSQTLIDQYVRAGC